MHHDLQRRTRRAAVAAAAIALVLSATPLAAQVIPIGEDEDIDPQAAAAYAALTTTPVGALPPMMTARMINGAQSKNLGLRFQFGHMDEEGDFSRRNLAGGIDIPFGAATLGFTGGYVDYACDIDEDEVPLDLDCGGAFMLGANLFTPLVTSQVGQGSSFVLGLDGALGFSSGEVLDAHFDFGGGDEADIKFSLRSLSGAVSFPLALVVRQPGLLVVPHFRPGFGYGRATIDLEASDPTGEQDEEDTESGTRFMLGGGVSFLFPNQGFGIEVGMQKVFIDEGDTVVGIGISFGR